MGSGGARSLPGSAGGPLRDSSASWPVAPPAAPAPGDGESRGCRRRGPGSKSLLPEIPQQDPGPSQAKETKHVFTKNKTLDSILNVEMMKRKKPEEIKQIWKQYFSGEDTVYAVIPGKTFDLMWKRIQNCPSFLYALPRKEGYEFFVGQWSGAELHFTSLINIQTQADAAPSQLILYHYPELQEEKGIVLMTAEMDSKFLSVAEAQCLASQVQLFYATERQETFRLVEAFNHQPDEFKYMSVISELEVSGLGEDLRPQQDSPSPTA
ncbi:ATP synthase mitochondrial F1 complex assembly factor 1 isoform X2 [Elgaria multicarinata webbii]|uniref:ATP synthase mitochondrial F1 complex assembly factor 1 isoform X2 n=1 Tax=Elgaria multicarinata webbii TaxID=159646 RepID=UPI002FCCDBB0